MSRIINYYNLFALLVISIIIITAVCRYTLRKGVNKNVTPRFRYSNLLYWSISGLLLLLGCLLRLWNLIGLPYGLQQDEASIGYEAFCLANYGIDRNGYHWPVYPITWGSGGGSPLMIYLNVITTKIFGSNVWSIRIVPAFLGCATLVLFFALLYRSGRKSSAIIGLVLLALTPWHIILSRWSLDSNTMPFFELLTILLLYIGSLRQSTVWYVASCIAGAVCLYDYGSATVVIPLFLLLACIFLLRRGLLNISQLIKCIVAFLIVVMPLALFYAINFLGLPEIHLSWISFPKFSATHATAFTSISPASVFNSIKDLLLILSFGVPNEDLWNAMPEYSALYVFMFPLIILGIGIAVKQLKYQELHTNAKVILHFFMLAMFLSSILFAFFIHQDINRMVLIFIPAIYFEVIGIQWLLDKNRLMTVSVLILYLVGFASFGKDYYGGYYNTYAQSVFMPGYREAMAYADGKAKASKDPEVTVYSTYTDVASPFMITLYATKYDPYDFIESTVYKDLESDFHVANAFGNFVFGLPDDDLTSTDYDGDIFVVTKEEAELFESGSNDYSFTSFGNFMVIS